MTTFKTDAVTAIKYLEAHKKPFGFGDYKITVTDKMTEENESVARTGVNWLERRLDVTLYKQYKNRPDPEKTLLHELIHAAIVRHQQEADEKCENIRYLEEEKTVNVFTDAYHELLALKKQRRRR